MPDGLNDDHRRILFNVMLRQDRFGRESSTMLMSKLREQIDDTYGPLFDSGLLTYERFGTGKNALASLIVTPQGLRYCIEHYDELERLCRAQ